MSTGLHTVHVRVNDAATGQPTPVRIRFADAQGTYYAPLGRLTHFAIGDDEDVGGNLLLGGKKYAYIPGTCEINLPPGAIEVEVHKGPEFIPQLFEDRLGAGQLTLRYNVERWTDLRAGLWYSGDMRAHALTPHAALLEAAAEDLAVVNLLIEVSQIRSTGDSRPRELWSKQWLDLPEYPVLSNVLAFSGQQPALATNGHLVVVNSFNYHPVMGFLSLLNCHRLIHPLEVDDDEALGRWTFSDWCDQCHRKGGLVVWDGYPGGYLSDLRYGEGLADLLLGKIDAIEMDRAAESLTEHWYPFLECGCRVPIVAASGKRSNDRLLGSYRTYARLQPGQELNYKNWIEAIRAGRTFVTSGPLLNFTVDGQDPGAVLTLPGLAKPVHVTAEARSFVPFDRMELLLNGQVLAEATASGSPATATMDLSTSLPAAGWLAVRCSGSRTASADSAPRPVSAHTSPIYVQLEGQPVRTDPMRVAELLACLDRWLAALAQQDHVGNGRKVHRLSGIFASARQVLRERMQSAGTA